MSVSELKKVPITATEFIKEFYDIELPIPKKRIPLPCQNYEE